MSIIVFWLGHSEFGDEARHKPFLDTELTLALNWCSSLRDKPNISHVTMVSELSNNVGKPGVDSVVDGKTPDGHDYDWSKSDRAGKMRKSDATKVYVKES